MKWMNEATIDELKKQRKILFFLDLFYCIMGGFVEIIALLLYFSTKLIGLPVMVFIMGVSLLVLGALPNNLSIMIYLKEQEKK